MSKATQSAISGVVVAVLALLVSLGVFGGDKATAIQAVANALIALAATVGIRSALPAKPDPSQDPSQDASQDPPAGE